MTAELAGASGRIGAVDGSAQPRLAERLARLRALDARLLTAAQLPAPRPRAAARAEPGADSARLAEALGGTVLGSAIGRVVSVEREVEMPFDPRTLLGLPFPIDVTRPLVMLDTETTGLGTGAGTLVFLVGLATWHGSRLLVRQLWLTDQPDEPALLDALEAVLPSDGWLVTYNGRAFDWPLIATRYRLHRRDPPTPAGHLDLLPVARQLWRHRLPDARLASVEAGIAGVRRSSDLPGALVPERYLAFLRNGDPRPLVAVGEHNRQDVVSLGRLLVVLAEVLGRPEGRAAAHLGDLVALGRLFRRAGRTSEALACLDAALGRTADGPAGGSRETAHRMVHEAAIERARLLRRLGRRAEAVEAWLAIASEGGRSAIVAWIAVAKELEHSARDPAGALAATQRAEELLSRRRALGLSFPEAERDLPRRRARLLRRLARLPRSRMGLAT